MSIQSPSQMNGQTNLELGDFIQIFAPDNPSLNEQIFHISYLSPTLMKSNYVDDPSREFRFQISPDGSISEESIREIRILARADEQGYARQNGLVKDTWIRMVFGEDGESEVLIRGLITDLTDDMIEVRRYPFDDSQPPLYIDFGYIGVPENLMIQSISIIKPPAEFLREQQAARIASGEAVDSTDAIQAERDEFEDIADATVASAASSDTPAPEGVDTEFDSQIANPNKREDSTPAKPSFTIVNETEKKIQSEFGIFEFGDEVEEIAQQVRIPENKRIYGIDTQLGDLLEGILASIPMGERTPKVLRRVHTIIERYRELRNKFSVRGDDGFIDSALSRGSEYRPVADEVSRLRENIPWIIPVAESGLRTFDIVQASSSDSEPSDVGLSTIKTFRMDEVNINKQIKDNSIPDRMIKYQYLVQKISELYNPNIDPIDTSEILDFASVRARIPFLVDNHKDDSLISTTVSDEAFVRSRFVERNALAGETMLYAGINEGVRFIERRPVMNDDRIFIKSIITMPYPYIEYSKVRVPNSTIYQRANLNRIPIQRWELLNDAGSIKTQIRPIYSHIQIKNKSNLEPEQDSLNFIQKMLIHPFNHIPDRESVIKLFESIPQGRSITSSSDYLKYLNDDSNRMPESVYASYLMSIIPRTRQLFEALKTRIPLAVNLRRVIQSLSSFFIEHDTLTFKQYHSMLDHIQSEIRRVLLHISQEDQKVLIIRNMEPYIVRISDFARLIDDEDNMYSLTYQQHRSVYPEEGYVRVLAKDYGAFFNEFVANNQTRLLTLKDTEQLLKDTLGTLRVKQNEQRATERESADSCYKYVIVKRYNSVIDLTADNGKSNVFVDAEYDILANPDVQRKRETMKSDKFQEYIANLLLMGKEATDEESAMILAKEVIAGRRPVESGQYAIVPNSEIHRQNGKYDYYIRNDANMWVVDSALNANTPDSSAFCNLQDRCLRLKDTPDEDGFCESLELNKTSVIVHDLQRLLKSMSNDIFFDRDRSKISDKSVEKARIRLNRLIKLYQRELSADSIIKYNIGLTAMDPTGNLSPYVPLRDRILGIPDMVQKMEYLRLFTQKFTRGANIAIDEDENWLYCVVSETKLLPSFFTEIIAAMSSGASGSLLNPVYANIIKKRGRLSDDGDKYVDVHSGYTIRVIDFSDDDGMDSDGNQLRGIDVLESTVLEDVLDTIDSITDENTAHLKMSQKQQSKQKQEKLSRAPSTTSTKMDASKSSAMTFTSTTPLTSEQHSIVAISKTILSNIGLNDESLIRSVIIYATKKMALYIKKEDYEAKARAHIEAERKKGKTSSVLSYESARSKKLIITTLAALHLAIQSSIPPIKPTKSYPGCGMSFTGFPLTGAAIDKNTGGLDYIICVAVKTANALGDNSIEFWKAIRFGTKVEKIKELRTSIITTIQEIIDQYPEISTQLEAKNMYLKEHKDLSLIPESISINRWSTFLPPLRAPVIENVKMITPDVRREFEKALITGDKTQIEGILFLQGLATQFSMQMQQIIQKIMDENAPLLASASGLKFQQNVCCEELGKMDMKEYLDRSNADIRDVRTYIEVLEQILDLTRNKAKAGILFDPNNTREELPSLRTDYGEETIYSTFIKFCQFNRKMILPSEVEAICGNLEIDGYDELASLEEKINLLKEQNIVYTSNQLKKLLKAVGSTTMINISDISQLLENNGGIREGVDGNQDDSMQDEMGETMDIGAGASAATAATPAVSKQLRLRPKLNSILIKKQLKSDPCQGFFSTLEMLRELDSGNEEGPIALMAIYFLNSDITNEDNLIDNAVQMRSDSMDGIMEFITDSTIPNELSAADKRNIKNALETLNQFNELQSDGYDSSTIITENRAAQFLKESIQEVVRIIPNMLAQKKTKFFTELEIPKYWKFASRHNELLKKKITDSYEYINSLRKYDDDSDFNQNILEVASLLEPITILADSVNCTKSHFVSNINGGSKRFPPIGERTRIEILSAILMFSYMSFVNHITQLIDEAQSDETAVDYAATARLNSIKVQFIHLLSAMIQTINFRKSKLNFNEKMIADAVVKFREREKTNKTDKLKDMSTEQRNVEMLLKDLKLEEWGIGLSKGLTRYDKEVFDREMNEKSMMYVGFDEDKPKQVDVAGGQEGQADPDNPMGEVGPNPDEDGYGENQGDDDDYGDGDGDGDF